MAYVSSTAAGANVPVLIAQPMAYGRLAISTNSTAYGAGSSNVGGALWLYMSTHLQTDVATAGFITDGKNLGMRVLDTILAISLSSGVSFHRVTTVSSTGITASAGLLISSAS